MQSYPVTDSKSLATLQSFLQMNHLPFADVQLANSFYLLYYDEGELMGSIGLEWYDAHALLRSVAISEKWRGKGLGKAMVADILQEAKKANKEGVFLLTETAAPFFRQLGFTDFDRVQTPKAIQSSSEFSHVCPSSASLMFVSLTLEQ
ncbi:MAG: arsenic resistance N-acetyltransferase ArsN2 [Cyclobacteriaceae bacterium]|jgi:amino-acid N-acetyltransferase|nr:arsenic resistance N-acetyltransferase ArsN2 [Flammeovirgaceae bacterium]